jgi:hypothetical protein
VTISYASVRIGQVWDAPVPAVTSADAAWVHGRILSYRYVGGSIGCGMVTIREDEVVASDGTYLESYYYSGASDGARAYLADQLPALDNTNAVWPITAGDGIAGGKLIKLSRPIRIGSARNGGECRFVFARLAGSTACVVYGLNPPGFPGDDFV